MNLDETEQQVFSDMYRLYCDDARAAQERKDEANRVYYKEIRRNGLRLVGLSSDAINEQLPPQCCAASNPRDTAYVVYGSWKPEIRFVEGDLVCSIVGWVCMSLMH